MESSCGAGAPVLRCGHVVFAFGTAGQWGRCSRELAVHDGERRWERSFASAADQKSNLLCTVVATERGSHSFRQTWLRTLIVRYEPLNFGTVRDSGQERRCPPSSPSRGDHDHHRAAQGT
jgi:hypothetical protein